MTLHQRPVALFVFDDGTEEIVHIHSWPPPNHYEMAIRTTPLVMLKDPVHVEFAAQHFIIRPGIVSSQHEFLIDGKPTLAPVYMEVRP